MQDYTDAVLERQTLIGKFLDKLNYRPIRSLYKKMGNLLESIDVFLSSDEGSLSSLRSSLLAQMSSLARTFYQSSLVSYLRSGGDISKQFGEEVERAHIKGVTEREVIIRKIQYIIDKAKDLSLLKEELNNKWQEIYYLLSTESDTQNSFRQKLALVNEKNKEYIQKYFSNQEDKEEVEIQKQQIGQITDLSFHAAELGDKAQMTLHELLDLSLNPLVSVFEDEINSAEKILAQIEIRKEEEENIAEEQLGRLCDVLSWGLDDITSVEELIKIGKELRNELASILSEFLVFLVDIDLEIQELETFILENIQV
ncbi:MAG: hypothetical protein ACTSQE_12020 [Candidatus Heimdallarchaeaceae archaeon]